MNEVKPLVSVVVTTHNRKEFLGETIESILNQTYDHFELIIVDDGSTDNTKEAVSSYNDNRIRYIYTHNWGGPARPRNIGIEAATGDYIAFCDDDDLWYPNKLICQLKMFENNSSGLCFTNYDYIDNHGKRINKKHKIKKSYRNLTFNKFIFSGSCICNSSVMIRREVVNTVGLINEDRKLIAFEDCNYWARILHKYKAICADRELVSYRINSINSIQNTTNTHWLRKEIYLLNSINSIIRINKIIHIIKLLKVLFIYLFRNVTGR